MPLPDPAALTELLRQALARYEEPLLRQVAARLVRRAINGPSRS